jgi:hypothetical protein
VDKNILTQLEAEFDKPARPEFLEGLKKVIDAMLPLTDAERLLVAACAMRFFELK